jgi:hypothetical protein
MEFFPPPNYTDQEIRASKTCLHLEDPHTCNKTTGLVIDSDLSSRTKTFGPVMQRHFQGVGAVVGNHGKDLNRVPNKQPIIWSRNAKESRTGLGFQMTYGRFENAWPWAFAIHKKRDWPVEMVQELDICKTRHRCYARCNAADKLEIGCHNDVSFQVVTK